MQTKFDIGDEVVIDSGRICKVVKIVIDGRSCIYQLDNDFCYPEQTLEKAPEMVTITIPVEVAEYFEKILGRASTNTWNEFVRMQCVRYGDERSFTEIPSSGPKNYLGKMYDALYKEVK